MTPPGLPPSRPAEPKPIDPVIRWTFTAKADLSHAVTARESPRCFVIDRERHLYALAHGGGCAEPQHLPGVPVSLGCSADGRHAAVLCEGGPVAVFDDRLALRAVRQTETLAVSVGVDNFGDRFALSFESGKGMIVDRLDRQIAGFDVKCPLHQLRFVPDRPAVLGLSNRGQLIALDMTGGSHWTCSFECGVGGFDCSHDGEWIVVASLNRGLTRVNADGVVAGTYNLDRTVTSVAVSWDGHWFLAGTTEGSVLLLDRFGKAHWTRETGEPIVGVGLDALARQATFATAGGHVAMVDLYPTQSTRATRLVSVPAREAPTAAEAEPPRLWSAEVGLPAPRGRVLTVAERGRCVTFVGGDGGVRCFDVGGHRIGRDWYLEPGDRLLVDPRGQGLWAVGTQEARHVDLGDGSLSQISLTEMDYRPAAIGPEGKTLSTAEGPATAAGFSRAGMRQWHHRMPAGVASLAVDATGRTLVADTCGAWWILSPSGDVLHQADAPFPQAVLTAALKDRFFLLSPDGRVRVITGDGQTEDREQLAFAPAWTVAAGPVLFVIGRSGLAVLDSDGRVVGRHAALEPASDVFYHPAAGAGVVRAEGDGLAGKTLDGQWGWSWRAGEPVQAVGCCRAGDVVTCSCDQHIHTFIPI